MNASVVRLLLILVSIPLFAVAVTALQAENWPLFITGMILAVTLYTVVTLAGLRRRRRGGEDESPDQREAS